MEFWGFGDSDIPQPTVGLPHIGLKSIGPPVGKDRWYSQMGQVGTGCSTWHRWDRVRGVSILGGTGWD